MNKEEVIHFYNEEKWKNLTAMEIVELQLNEELLCMPFDIFAEAIEKVFNRPFFSLELINRERILKEFNKIKEDVND